MTESSPDRPTSSVSLRLNDHLVTSQVPDGEFLAATLRDRLGLKGTKVSCAAEVCGSCTVLVDGLPFSSCTTLTVQADEREVTTIEGAVSAPEFDRVERAFLEHAAVQCGFCTPGFVMTLLYILHRPPPRPDDDELRTFLSANICRCTGYSSLMDAARQVLGEVP